MSTRLEAMVGLLAGRKAEPALLEELADPSSEASRFLEATRARSKALLGGPEGTPTGPSGKGRRVALAASVVAACALVAGMAWLLDRRFRVLDARLIVRDAEARAESARLEALLLRLAEPRPAPEPLAPLRDALIRIESELNRLEAQAGRPDPARGDAGVAQVREDLASIRRELAAAEKMGERNAEELRASVHDAARVLRLLLNRLAPQPAGPNPLTPTRPPANLEMRRLKPP